MARNKRSVASVVAEQAKARASNNVQLLDSQRHDLTKVIHGHDKAGREFLKVAFPRRTNINFEYDLSFLLLFPNLTEAFTQGFKTWGMTVGHLTRVNTRGYLTTYFFKFLEQRDLRLASLDDLSESVFVAYIQWLNRAQRDGKPFSHETRASALTPVRTIIRTLSEIPKWSAVARNIISFIPVKPWPGISRKSKPRERLRLEHFRAVIDCAEKEVLAIQMRWKKRNELLELGHHFLVEGQHFQHYELCTCLAAIDAAYPDIIPTFSTITKENPKLASAVRRHFSRADLESNFYAPPRDLVPFALLLTAATAFNPDTVLTLDWSNIAKQSRIGLPAVHITGRKNRAEKDPSVLLDASQNFDTVGIELILTLLQEMTVRIRTSIKDPDHHDRVFIFVPARKSNVAKAFGGKSSSPSGDIKWQYSLKDFIKTHDLPSFTLAQIRTTILDEVQLITGDLLAAQAVGQQKNPHTLWHHYTSDGVRKRHMEKIGEILLLRERWHSTNGTIDPRSRAGLQDVGAATPGFLCLDPFDSPRQNQKPGRLCNAYGECPSCPLAGANVSRAIDVAHYLALRKAIYDAQGRVAPTSWVNRWSPIIFDLEALISQVPREVLAEAKQFTVTLPPVG